MQNKKLITPEILLSLGQISGMKVSHDGSKLLYNVTRFIISENTSYSEIITMNLNSSAKNKVSHSNLCKDSAKWMLDGKHITYLSTESGSKQIWKMNEDGTNCEQITDIDGGIIDYVFSPDETKLLFISEIKSAQFSISNFSDLPKSTGIVINDLMYKHWDEWVQTIPHPFITSCSKNRKITQGIDLLQNEPYECPMKPFGGIEQLAWSPTGEYVAYTCRKKVGKEYAVSTNSNIYFYNIELKTTINITTLLNGYDKNPVFSPDGKWLAWESMERDGYESDKNRLFLMDIDSGKKTDLTSNFDQNVKSLCWSSDSKLIYFLSCWHAITEIYCVDILEKIITKITTGVRDYLTVTQAGENLIGINYSFSKPAEIYKIDTETGFETELSFENKDILDNLEFGNVEERWIATTDNQQMHSWVVYPPKFDPEKKYPTLLYCQGGPQSTVNQFWSYNWNFQLIAANGYIIIAPNRRGLPGFGKEWVEQISGDYGGQNMNDYFSAIDSIVDEPYVNKDKLGCIGASYGGFSVYWLAGHHNKRFKTFIAHAGMFNLHQQYLETDEMWFVNWDFGGAYWDKKNETAQRTYMNSPHLFVDKWDTPILIIHGEKDYRVLATQGMAAFNAAILRDIEAKLLYFPNENHWVNSPQNIALWYRTFFNWLDRWLK